jgi:hypothetical protein
MGRYVAVVLALGCGGDPSRGNVRSCEAYVDALECGSTDLSDLYAEDFCEDFEGAECDVTPYFDCLEENVTCDEESGQLLVDPDFVCGDLAACL